MITKNLTRGSGLLEVFLAKKRAQKADSFISTDLRDGNILDVGCGSFPYFLEFVDFANKFGIDPSLKSTNLDNMSLKKVDIAKQKLGFEDNFFDTVTMLAVFEHIEHKRLNFTLREILRVLKDGGLFIITTPAPWSDKLLHQMSKFGLISSVEIHDHKHHYSRLAIEKIIEDAGFKRKNIRSGYFELGMNMWFTARK